MDKIQTTKTFDTPETGLYDTKESNNVNVFNQGGGPSGSEPLVPYPQIHQSEIPPGTIKQRHLEAWIIFSGTLAKRPSSGSNEVKAYFATDNNHLYLWNGTSWVSTTLA